MASDLVKSAARALEILEVFADRREHLSMTQLGTALGYPKSSLSVLLKSLVAQGYLSNAHGDGEYFPTLKLARLGDWIPAALLGSESLLPMLEALRDKTGETVTLTMPDGLGMRCLHALIGTHPISLRVEEGVTFPTIGSAVGTAYLATQSPETAQRLFDAWTAQATGPSRKIIAAVEDQIELARRDGYTCAYDAVLADTGAIAMPIFPVPNSDPLIVAVAGLSARIHKSETAIIRAMQKTIARASEG